jgi:hypothetical protein
MRSFTSTLSPSVAVSNSRGAGNGSIFPNRDANSLVMNEKLAPLSNNPSTFFSSFDPTSFMRLMIPLMFFSPFSLQQLFSQSFIKRLDA